MNGKFVHSFLESGDYSGFATISGTDYKGRGVYEQGSEICWAIQEDGKKGRTGNVILYVDESQCCLEFRAISDKIAVTKVAVKGTGAGYAICDNQVLNKVQQE